MIKILLIKSILRGFLANLDNEDATVIYLAQMCSTPIFACIDVDVCRNFLHLGRGWERFGALMS